MVYIVLSIPEHVVLKWNVQVAEWMHLDGFANGVSGCIQVLLMLFAAVTTHRNKESDLGAQSSSTKRFNHCM